MKDFNLKIVAETIDYLVAHSKEQPDLESLAARAGYEATHFQKMFKQSVGISPKRLVQYMNVRHARGLLREGRTLLDSALDSGLSGTGRLHDLFVSVEGMTPGQVKNRGQGVQITYGFYPSILGEVLIAKTALGVCWLGFLMEERREVPVQRMKAFWPKAAFVHDDDSVRAVAQQVLAIWSGKAVAAGKLKLDLYGTNFQLQVWQALLRIPSGETVTYQDIAKTVCTEKASRAVGNAVGANPVSLLIPCHRVIRGTGIIDNYAWGSPRKKLILALENEGVPAGASGSEIKHVAHGIEARLFTR